MSSGCSSQKAFRDLQEPVAGEDEGPAGGRGYGFDEAVIEQPSPVRDGATGGEQEVRAEEAVVPDRAAQEVEFGGDVLPVDRGDDGPGADDEVGEAAPAAEEAPLAEDDVVEHGREDGALGPDVAVD